VPPLIADLLSQKQRHGFLVQYAAASVGACAQPGDSAERRKFTREFKLEAVRLIKERGVSYTQASEDLGVHQSQLRGWVKVFADDPQQAFPGPGQMKSSSRSRVSGAKL
jgi:transposase